MRQIFIGLMSAAGFLIACSAPLPTDVPTATTPALPAITELLMEDLYRDSLTLAPDVEVIVNYLEVPANSTLPTHWHPGEEFVYGLRGSGIVTVEDGSTIELSAGEFLKVPFKVVHSFSTGDEAAAAVVFRVHQKGEPDRVLVEQ